MKRLLLLIWIFSFSGNIFIGAQTLMNNRGYEIQLKNRGEVYFRFSTAYLQSDPGILRNLDTPYFSSIRLDQIMSMLMSTPGVLPIFLSEKLVISYSNPHLFYWAGKSYSKSLLRALQHGTITLPIRSMSA